MLSSQSCLPEFLGPQILADLSEQKKKIGIDVAEICTPEHALRNAGCERRRAAVAWAGSRFLPSFDLYLHLSTRRAEKNAKSHEAF